MFNFIRKLDRFLVRIALGVMHPAAGPAAINVAGIRNILIIKLWGLGNLIVISPLLYKIKYKFPQARVIFLTFGINRGFFENHQAVDRVIYFEFTTNFIKIIRQVCALISELKQEKIDIVINFETFNNMSAIFTCLIKAPVRIGLHNQHERRFYTHAVDNNKSWHISKVFSDLLIPLEIKEPYQYTRFKGTRDDKTRAASALGAWHADPFIVMHPSTSMNFLGKRFSEKNFSALADLLIVKHGMKVILTGTRQDRQVVGHIIAGIPNKDKVLGLTGCLTLGELTELLKMSRLFISNDTGPVHLAASVGVNVAAIYGPTTPSRFGPLNHNSLVFYKGLPCGPCVGVDYLNKRCHNDFQCLDF